MGQGWQRASAPNVFIRLRGGSQRSTFEKLADSTRVAKAEVTRQRLRSVLDAVGGEPCFGEDVTFDIAGNGFRMSFWDRRLTVVIEVIGPKTLQSHMWPPSVVQAFELGAQKRQVVKPFDDRHMPEPLILEGLDDPRGYGDGSVLSYGSEARFDVPLSQQLGKGIPDKDTGLV